MIALAFQTAQPVPTVAPAPPIDSSVLRASAAPDVLTYSEILEKTNAQLSHTLDAQASIVSWLSAGIGALSLLFAFGSIVAAILLYLQSRDAKKERARLVSSAEAKVAEASALVRTAEGQVQTLLKNARTQLVELEKRVDATIAQLTKEPPSADDGVAQKLERYMSELEVLKQTVRSMYDATGALVANNMKLGETSELIQRLLDREPGATGIGMADTDVKAKS